MALEVGSRLAHYDITALIGEGSSLWPVWLPDDRSLAFSSNRSGRFSLYRKPVDLSGPAEPLADDLLGHPALDARWAQPVPRGRETGPQMVLVDHWFEEPMERVPRP